MLSLYFLSPLADMVSLHPSTLYPPSLLPLIEFLGHNCSHWHWLIGHIIIAYAIAAAANLPLTAINSDFVDLLEKLNLVLWHLSHLSYRCSVFAGYNADIICLQEVDKKVFERDLLPRLEEGGLSGHLRLKFGDVHEGSAVFFRCSRFK